MPSQGELQLNSTVERWGVMWYSKNKLDGETKRLMFHNVGDDLTLPYLFKTRARARIFIKARWGYIKDRKDLRIEPHGWRMPRAVKVNCSFDYMEWPYE